MRLRKKKSLLDQASDYVESVRPQVEAAVAQARDAVEDFVETTARPALADARDKAGPALADARTRAASGLTDAREKAAPIVADARAKAVPLIATGAAVASEKAGAVKDLADAKVAQLKGEPPPKKKGGKLKKVAVIAAVAGVAGVVARKLQGGGKSENWQSSYVPSPPPAATTPDPTTPDSTTPVAAAPVEDDPGGASPDEAIADQAEGTHPVTTPDEPADVVPIDEGNQQ